MRLIPKLRKPTLFDFAQALERAGRVFAGAFIALYPLGLLGSGITGWVSGGDIAAVVDLDLAAKAAVAGLIATTQFLWRWLLGDVGRSVVAATAHVPAGEPTASHIDNDSATEV